MQGYSRKDEVVCILKILCNLRVLYANSVIFDVPDKEVVV